MELFTDVVNFLYIFAKKEVEEIVEKEILFFESKRRCPPNVF
jgi:hypothetical protein